MVKQLTDKFRQIMSLGECCRILFSSIQRCGDCCSVTIILKERLFTSCQPEMVDCFITTDPQEPERNTPVKMSLRQLTEVGKRRVYRVIC